MYGCQIWPQNLWSVTEKMLILQKINLKAIFVLHNCLFVYDYLKCNLSNSYINTFKRVDETYPKLTVLDQLVMYINQLIYFSIEITITIIHFRFMEYDNK